MGKNTGILRGAQGGGPTDAQARRFWSKVRRGPGCWLWTDSLTPFGYGEMRVGSKRDDSRRMEKAHRLSWLLSRGPIPDGLFVLHDCPGGDNRACVRPSHLFLGTQADNMADMARKGVRKGERHALVKLREGDVRGIVFLANTGATQRAIAGLYGVCRQTVSDIVRGRRWGHLGLAPAVSP